MKKYQEEKLTKKRLRVHELVLMMMLVGGAGMNELFVCSVTMEVGIWGKCDRSIVQSKLCLNSFPYFSFLTIITYIFFFL